MANSRWSLVQTKIRAVIGGVPFDDCIGFTGSWSVNEIPSAILHVGVGRRSTTGGPATIHDVFDLLEVKQRAIVYLRVIPLGASPGDAENWPANEFVLFEGYTGGPGWTRSSRTVSVAIHLKHWLEDLDNSSSISAASHPLNPANYAYGATFSSMDLTGAGSGDPNYVPVANTQDMITTNAIEEDLWALVLRPWLIEVAGQDKFSVAELPGVGGKPNAAALAALNRMHPTAAVPLPPEHVPAAMKTLGASGVALANAISQSLMAETFNSWANTTLWGKLVGQWAPSYGLAVIPRITDALVEPLVAGLCQPYKTILAEEYDPVNLQAPSPSTMQGVGIVAPVNFRTGADMGLSPTSANLGLIGYFQPADATSGKILFKQPPPWLSDMRQMPLYSRHTTGLGGESGSRTTIGTAFSPGEGTPSEIAAPSLAMESISQPDSIMSAYARQLFITEQLKARRGELSGKLRFDIAPGSTVAVEAANEKFLGVKDKLGAKIYGGVIRVTININSETKQASTAFSIGHIRSARENKSERTSIEGPPFYQDPWPGAPLSSLGPPVTIPDPPLPAGSEPLFAPMLTSTDPETSEDLIGIADGGDTPGIIGGGGIGPLPPPETL